MRVNLKTTRRLLLHLAAHQVGKRSYHCVSLSSRHADLLTLLDDDLCWMHCRTMHAWSVLLWLSEQYVTASLYSIEVLFDVAISAQPR